MFERILVPLDGSTRAARAVPVAARIAGATHGSVILVSIVNHFVLLQYPETDRRDKENTMPLPTLPDIDSSHQTMPKMSNGFVLGGQASTYNNRTRASDDISMSEAEMYLEEMARSPELAHVTVEKAILFGPVASTLLYAATSCRADLIVISSHGRSGIMSKMLGSVSEKVICRSTVPVLLLRENAPLPLGPFSDAAYPLRVLVALNGTSFANAVLNPAAELAAALASPYRGKLHLARVVLPPEIVKQKHVYGSSAVTMEQAQKSLASVASYLNEGLMAPAVAQHRLAVTWAAIESERVAETLVHLAEHEEEGVGTSGRCDVIAMATHGLTGLQRLTLGSMAAHVMALTQRPILLVRPTAQMQADRTSEMRVNV